MIVIVVPVLGRPERVRALMESVRRSTSVDHRLLFVCSPDDHMQIRACKRAGAETVVLDEGPGPGDFAKKINLGYRESDEPFLLVGADDLRFHSGWDTAALEVAERTKAGVVGTNDLHNPRVLRGEHSTHPLVRRSYIELYGGTFDRTGEVLCELYDHQFVDDELCLTAKLRGQWAFAESSHVEHLHPYFGLAKMDATYQKALRATRDDRRLFHYRQRELRRALRR